MSCYSERAEILKIKDEYRSEFEDFYYGRYEKIKTQFLRDYLDETAGQKHCDKISSLNGVTYYEEYSVFDHSFYKDGYFIYGYYYNINNYNWCLTGDLLCDIEIFMSDVVFGVYYDEIDMDIGLTPYSVVDNTKEYGF